MMRACSASFSGGMVWLIIRNPTVSSPSSRASPKCWIETSASVQWVAIRQIDAAVVLRLLDVLLGAHAGQHQERDLGLLRRLGGELDQFLLGGFGEPVVEGGAAETVTVGDLDDRHTGGVEGGDDGADLVLGELVALVVRTVAQRRVGDADVPDRVEKMHRRSCIVRLLVDRRRRFCLAISSPTLVAAAVMMSRLPAYGRQVVACALDLDEGRHLGSSRRSSSTARRTAVR